MGGLSFFSLNAYPLDISCYNLRQYLGDHYAPFSERTLYEFAKHGCKLAINHPWYIPVVCVAPSH